MKTIAVIAILAFCGAAFADEDKKTKIINFYKCISCSKDPVVIEEYMKCAELKPEKCKAIAEACKKEVMPEAVTLEDRLSHVCKSEHEEAEKLYECISNHEDKKTLNDSEKDQFKEFLSCAKKVNKKHCDSP